jgi:hypothetical protein
MDLDHEGSRNALIILDGLVMVVPAVRVAPRGWCGMLHAAHLTWSVLFVFDIG